MCRYKVEWTCDAVSDDFLVVMSFGRPPTFSSFQVLPPERGSFPLDHYGTYTKATCLYRKANARALCKSTLCAWKSTRTTMEHAAIWVRHTLSAAWTSTCIHEMKMQDCLTLLSQLMERDSMDNLGFADIGKNGSTTSAAPPDGRGASSQSRLV